MIAAGGIEQPELEEHGGFHFAIFAFPTAAETLIGLLVTPGFALIDTGAQHGVIGLPDYNKLCDRLAAQGLKPRALPLFRANAIGVGGATKFLKSAEVPVGIQGVSGIIDVNVIDTDLPFLLPMSFCRKAGMILDTIASTATWKNLGDKVSDVVTLDTDHIAIDLLEFPTGGWENPHQKRNVQGHTPNTAVDRAEFECTPTPRANSAVCTATLLKPSALLPAADAAPTDTSPASQRVGDVESSMPHSPERGEPRYRERLGRGRGGRVIRIREDCSLAYPDHQDSAAVSDDRNADQGQVPPWSGSVRPVAAHSDSGSLVKPAAHQVPHHQGADCGQTTSSGGGPQGSEDRPHGPSNVRTQQCGHDATRQCQEPVVDLQKVPDPLGALPSVSYQLDGGRAPGSGPGDFRQAHGVNLLGGTPASPPVLRVGVTDTGARGELASTPAPCPLHLPKAHGSDIRGRRFRPGNVSRLVQGAQLAAKMCTVTVGLVAHVVSGPLKHNTTRTTLQCTATEHAHAMRATP